MTPRILVLLAALLCVSCGKTVTPEGLAAYVIVDEAVDAAVVLQSEHPNYTGWEYRSTPDLETLVGFVRRHVSYSSVNQSVWKTPAQTWNDGFGDCEDLTFLTAALMRFIGYSGDLCVVYGTSPAGNLHIWFEVYPDGIEEGFGHVVDVSSSWCAPLLPTQSREVWGYSASVIALIP